MALMTEVLKRKKFRWTPYAQKAFKTMEERPTSAHILTLLNFAKVFEVECDAPGVRIGAGLT